MTRSAKPSSRSFCLAIIIVLAAAGSTTRQAEAQFCCSGPPPDDVTDYAVLYEGDPHNLHVTNSFINSNIGIGDTGGFIGSVTTTAGGTVNGQVRFAASTGLFSLDGFTVTGGATFGNASVQTNLNMLNMLSQQLKGETGTS